MPAQVTDVKADSVPQGTEGPAIAPVSAPHQGLGLIKPKVPGTGKVHQGTMGVKQRRHFLGLKFPIVNVRQRLHLWTETGRARP